MESPLYDIEDLRKVLKDEILKQLSSTVLDTEDEALLIKRLTALIDTKFDKYLEESQYNEVDWGCVGC